MRLVKFVDIDGDTFYLNADYIRVVLPDDDPDNTILLVHGTHVPVVVVGTSDVIAARIDPKQC